jgi:hypothetical protein
VLGVVLFLALKKDATPTKIATGSATPTGSNTTTSSGSAGSATGSATAPVTAGALHSVPAIAEKGSAAPTKLGKTAPIPAGSAAVAVGSAATGSATGIAAGEGSGEGTASGVSGTTLNAVSGFKLIVPPGFKTQRQGKNLIAQTKGYTIVIGPITSKQEDPAAAAKEYAEQVGLQFDGVVDLDLDGVSRPGAAFHGVLYGDDVAQSIINYIGPGYRVAVSLTMPYANRNHPQVRAFADELFAKRVIVPSPY